MCVFRFGPLLWRSSKERKRGQQLGRGGIFRSADSGIHVERSMAAESSDSRDTDPNDEPDSPLVRVYLQCLLYNLIFLEEKRTTSKF